MTYRECYEAARRLLAGSGIEEGDLDARLLLEFVCGTDRNTLLAHGDREVSGEEGERLERLLERRAAHVPLQHLTGTQNFMGLDFLVNEHVLIPRQDTEILVEEVLKDLHDGMRILDLGTGSGCILISLLHFSNDCEGVGVDISPEALKVAEENARRLLRQKVLFLQGDLFEPVAPLESETGRFDLIVSNPPYIPTDVIPTLMEEVREHEPWTALDGSGDGLVFYRRILADCGGYLVRGGKLYFEIGYDQGPAVSAMMAEAGFREVEVVQDYGGLDRVVFGTYLGG